MVLFVPGRVQQILDRGRAEGRAEARAQARAEFERALEDAEVSEELKAKILSSVPADKNPAKFK